LIVSALKAYSYAVVRVVPRIDRDEFVNAGVIVCSQELRYLDARVVLPEERIRALWPEADMETIRRHLDAIPKIAAGEATGGTIAGLTLKERFHWLTVPRNTMIQVSPVRSGLTDAPEAVLEQLYAEFAG
jgi:hypothetical protein